MRSKRSILVAALALTLLAWSCGDDPATVQPDPEPPPPGEDVTPPEAIADLSLSYDPSTFDVRIAWTAPRDDGDHDRVARYQIRYSFSFPMSWWTAVQVADPPTPQAAGSPQSYTIPAPGRGRYVYAAIRSLDAADNFSPVSSVAEVRIPGYGFEAACADARTGVPVEGLDVLVTERFTHQVVTGADGVVALADLTGGSLTIRIDTGAAPATYHSLQEAFVIDTDHAVDYPMIEFETVSAPVFENLLAMLWEACGRSPVLLKWRSLPVEWYAPAFVNANGLDYYDAAARAAARWNEATGLPLFVAVGAPAAVGVHMEFLPPASMGGQNGITSYTNDGEGYPLVDRIRIVDSFADGDRLYSIMLHELGHTIRLRHLNDPSYIMFASQPLPDDISNDEVRLVQLLTALPNAVKLEVYDRSSPP
ncbi:MAG TPA: hypothetical protein VEC56_06730 [Candidatus Krumholzibacteria bacterium]|nr:hypothetical protein [Candidatus Krumholzibacteria bacterium]